MRIESIYATSRINPIPKIQKQTYPCTQCGECPIWLAAYKEPELQAKDAIAARCRTYHCHLVGKEA